MRFVSALAALLLAIAWSPNALACRSAAGEPAFAVPAFRVAVSGDDGADGTEAHPFRTMERARQAMADSLVRTTYVEGGTYAFDQTLRLDARDSLVSFIGCPGQWPTLDAGRAHLSTLVELAEVTDVTVRGFTFANATGAAMIMLRSSGVHLERNHFEHNGTGVLLSGTVLSTICANRVMRSAASGVEAKDGSDDNVFAHNVVDGTGAPATHGGGIFVHGASRNAIVRNLVRNTRGVGIGVVNWDASTVNVGTVIAGNVVRDSNQDAEDSGAIYLLGRTHVDMRSRVVHNLIDGNGPAGDAHTIGIYLDDSTSGVRVEGNLIRNFGTHGAQIHGGDDVLIRNNIFDVRPDSTSAVLFQAAPADTNPANTMRNNRVMGNVVLVRGRARAPYSFLDGGAPEIAGNLLLSTQGWPARAGIPEGDLGMGVPWADASEDSYAEILAAAAARIGFAPISLVGVGPDPNGDCSAARRWRMEPGG